MEENKVDKHFIELFPDIKHIHMSSSWLGMTHKAICQHEAKK